MPTKAPRYDQPLPVTERQIAEEAVARARLRMQARTESPIAKAFADTDYIAFYRNVLGVETMYDKQDEMVTAVHTSRRVSVSGCNTSGKDFCSGRIVLDWLNRYSPSKVVILGPTDRQVRQIVWAETRSAFNLAKYTLPGRMLPVAPQYHISDQQFAVGFATDEPFNIQGFHSENLLVVLTEAHAIPQAHIDAVKRLNPRCILMTGNPLVSDGEFYESHHDRREDWRTITISAFDTPNVIEGRTVVPGLVTREDIEAYRNDWGEDNPLYIATVLGQFPANLSLGVVSLEDARLATTLTFPKSDFGVLALDVGGAEDGGDKTVLAARFGSNIRILYKANGENTRQTAHRVYHDWYLPLRHRLTHVVVDGIGIGAGVVDSLRELDVPVIDFRAGSTPESSRYANRGAEVWGRLAVAIRKHEASLPDDRSLIGQLVGRKFLPQPSGKLALEPKLKMRTDGRHSPDEADAVAMTYAVYDPGPDAYTSPVLSQQSLWSHMAGNLEPKHEYQDAPDGAKEVVGDFLVPLVAGDGERSKWRRY